MHHLPRKLTEPAREVLAGVKAVPICGWSDGCWRCRRHSLPPSRASAPIHLKVASRKAPAGTPPLRTDSHKHTHAAVAITGLGARVAELTINVGRHGYRQLET